MQLKPGGAVSFGLGRKGAIVGSLFERGIVEEVAILPLCLSGARGINIPPRADLTTWCVLVSVRVLEPPDVGVWPAAEDEDEGGGGSTTSSMLAIGASSSELSVRSTTRAGLRDIRLWYAPKISTSSASSVAKRHQPSLDVTVRTKRDDQLAPRVRQ
jgi:hypothetical protein